MGKPSQQPLLPVQDQTALKLSCQSLVRGSRFTMPYEFSWNFNGVNVFQVNILTLAQIYNNIHCNGCQYVK